MDDPSAAPLQPQQLTVDALGRATRFALGMIVILLTYFPFRLSYGIPAFEKIFEDMLGAGSQLPLVSRFVFSAAPFMMFLNSALFALAVGTLFLRRIKIALYTQGVVALIAVVSCIFIYQAVFMPLTEIIRRMQGAPVTSPDFILEAGF